MSRIVDAGFDEPAEESVILQGRTLDVATPLFRAAVADVVDRIAATGVAARIDSPLEPANAGLISNDGRSAPRHVRHPGRP
jgi:hypothetical protein